MEQRVGVSEHARRSLPVLDGEVLSKSWVVEPPRGEAAEVVSDAGMHHHQSDGWLGRLQWLHPGRQCPRCQARWPPQPLHPHPRRRRFAQEHATGLREIGIHIGGLVPSRPGKTLRLFIRWRSQLLQFDEVHALVNDKFRSMSGLQVEDVAALVGEMNLMPMHSQTSDG